MPLKSVRICVFFGLITPSLTFADDGILLRGASSINEERLSLSRALKPAVQISIAQFALNGVFLPELYELAVQQDGSLLLSISSLVEIADGLVYNKNTNDLGFYLSSPDEGIDVSISDRTVSFKGKSHPFTSDDLIVIDGVQYFSYSLLSKIIGFSAEYSEVNGTVNITTAAPWPREQRVQRERRWARLRNPALPERDVSIRLALAYELSGAPQADVSVSIRKDAQGQLTGDYNVNLVSEALYMTNVLSLTGSMDKGISNLRAQTGRADPTGGVFGVQGLYQFLAGDVTGFSLPVVGSIASGRGVVLRGAPLDQGQGFDQTEITGDAPAGWDVELYVSGSLQAVGKVAEDGRYRFRDIQLQYGPNDYRIVLYGPNGQRRERTIQRTVGGSLLRPGAVNSYAYFAQPNARLFDVGQTTDLGTKDLVGLMKVDYGVSNALTMSGFLARSQFTDSSSTLGARSKVSDFIGLEARPAFDRANLDFGMVKQVHGGSGAYSRFSFPLGNYSINSSISAFSPDFYSSGNQYGLNWIRRRFRLRSNIPLGTAYGGGYLGLEAERIGLNDKSHATTVSLSYGHRLGFAYLNHNLEGEKFESAPLNTDTFQARYRGLISSRFRNVGLRGQLSYLLTGPGKGFESLGLNTYWSHSSGATINGSYIYPTTGASSIAFNLTKKYRNVLLSIGVIKSASSSYSLQAGLNFSLGYGPNEGPLLSSEPRTGYSQARLHFYHDKDGDGQYDAAKDSPVPGVSVYVNDRKREDPSDATGHIVLDRLGTDSPQRVRINSVELSDSFLVATTSSLEFNPRPGQIHSLPFRLTDAGEVNGTVKYVNDQAEPNPLANVRLQIVGEDGLVQQETISLTDGFYSFDQVYAGNWTIRLHPDQVEYLREVGMQPANVALSPSQLIRSGVNLLVTRPDVSGKTSPP